jgi:hypothetical protein
MKDWSVAKLIEWHAPRRRIAIAIGCAAIWVLLLLVMREASHAHLESWQAARADARYRGCVWWITGSLLAGLPFALWRWSPEAAPYGIWTWRLLTFAAPCCCLIIATYGLGHLPPDFTFSRQFGDLLGLLGLISLPAVLLAAILALVAVSDEVHQHLSGKRQTADQASSASSSRRSGEGSTVPERSTDAVEK